MSNTAEIKIDGNAIELPVIEGSEQEKAIDISKLRAQSGIITIDPGFKNTGSTKSAITFLDGEKGIYKIEVTKHTVAPKMDSYKSYAKDPSNNINAVGSKVMEALKKKATIEDNRASFY